MKLRTLSLLTVLTLLFSAFTVIASAAEELPFTDVKSGKWYSDAVANVYDAGIMEGKSEGIFAPFENMTRAQLVTILSRLANADTTGCAAGLTFKDTKKTAWYADAVGWSVSAGLVTGYDDNTFRPNAQVLRQELAVLFARFLDANSISLQNVDEPVTFADAKKIPSWAAEGVEVMRLTGIVGGDQNGNFNPKKSANRAEIAVMLTRYLAALENAVDPMHAKFADINNLVNKDMGKIAINLYLYERFTDYGHTNSVSEQLLPQIGLDVNKYEMVSTEDELVNINESIVHGISAADEEKGAFFIKAASFFIRNKNTGEVTETKHLGFKINRIVTPEDTNLVFDSGIDNTVYEEMINRTHTATGNVARFAKAFAKAKAGESITVGYIGGSITQGAVSGIRRQHSWACVSYEWLREQFPSSEVKYVNAGIGGTPSEYGNFRAEPHLLSYDPDIIFIEFSVNDSSSSETHRESYEALLRRSLNDENAPAVALVISALANDDAVARVNAFSDYYGVPVVNVDLGIEYGVEAGAFTMKEYAPDGIHPYEWGHKIMGDMVINMLKNTMATIDSASASDLEVTPVPEKPLSGCTFDNLKYLGIDDLTSEQIGTFTLIEGSADGTPGTYEDKASLHGENDAKMSFTVEAKNLAILFDCESMTITINGETREFTDKYDFELLYSSDATATLNIEITAHTDTTIFGFSYN